MKIRFPILDMKKEKHTKNERFLLSQMLYGSRTDCPGTREVEPGQETLRGERQENFQRLNEVIYASDSPTK